MSSELSREERLVAAAIWGAGPHSSATDITSSYEPSWDACVAMARRALAKAALSGGGGGEKAGSVKGGECGNAQGRNAYERSEIASLESRLAAAEKERGELKAMVKFRTDSRNLADAARVRLANENDGLKEKLAAAEKRAEEAERRAAASNEIAGKALGTDPTYYNDGCVAALAHHAECLRRTNGEHRAELQSLRANRDSLARELAEAKKQGDAALARVKEVEADADALRSIIVKMEADFEAIRADKDRYESGLAQIATALRDFSKMVPEIDAWLAARAAAGAQP